jgi:hypothetical protein
MGLSPGLCCAELATVAAAAHVTVQRAVVTVTRETTRVCGGRAFLRRYRLERYARDARAAALMRPWTQHVGWVEPGETRRWHPQIGFPAQPILQTCHPAGGSDGAAGLWWVVTIGDAGGR